MRRSIPAILVLVIVALLAVGSAPFASAQAQSGSLSEQQRRTLNGYAADTWKSFVALADPQTGLAADNVAVPSLERSGYTSPTNIGAYLWSTLAARDLQIITPAEARQRIGQTLATLAQMERSHGLFFNWYDPATAAKLTVWPPSGTPLHPFLSTVDNGWLAAALMMVANSVPQERDAANAILADMDFGFFYHASNGLLYGGYWPEGTNECNVGGYTCFDFGTLNTEPRIASYIGIARGQLPATHYFKMWRTFPSTCDWGWQEMKPAGVTQNYLGVDVFEGHYTYRGMNIVPSWGGSMFEALMVTLFVPEAQWGPRSWGVNHPLYVEAQIEHGLNEANYGYWGFSPSNDPAGGYREYGVDPIGLNPDGYTSDEERTTVDYGFAADIAGDPPCRPAQPLPSHYGQGVVTPHASFLALPFAPDAALQNLEKLRSNFDAYGPLGFYDAVNVSNGAVSKYELALDQGMIMAASVNALRNERLQDYFTRGAVEQNVRPLLEMEQFTAGQ
jgi:hypothetical protein